MSLYCLFFQVYFQLHCHWLCCIAVDNYCLKFLLAHVRSIRKGSLEANVQMGYHLQCFTCQLCAHDSQVSGRAEVLKELVRSFARPVEIFRICEEYQGHERLNCRTSEVTFSLSGSEMKNTKKIQIKGDPIWSLFLSTCFLILLQGLCI